MLWIESPTLELRAKVLEAMDGVIGIRVDAGQLSRFEGGKLATYHYIPGVTASGNATLCPALLQGDVATVGVPSDPYVAYGAHTLTLLVVVVVDCICLRN
jgi:hypothetical protein